MKNSGRSQGTAKGDAILEDFVIDYKEYAKSFPISLANIAKLDTDAWKNGQRTGVFKIVLNDTIRRWVVPEFVFHDYLVYRKLVNRLQQEHPDIYAELSDD